MSDKILYIDADAYEREVLQSAKPVVVDFYSEECPPCEALAAKYETLAEVYGDDIKFIKVFRQKNRPLAEKLGVRSSPTVLFYRKGDRVGDMLTGGIKRSAIEKNLDTLLPAARVVELRSRIPRSVTECDVLIVGGGPGGLTAGLYAAQGKLRTIIVDRGLAGGNVAITHRISNFPGFVDPQPGHQLAANMTEQTKRAGAELRQAVDLTSIDYATKTVVVDGTETIRGKRLIVATGSSPRPLGVKGENEYRGRGVSYCATCDAKYYEGKHVLVIGGGNTAIGESLFIANFASQITVVHQFDKLQANQELQEKAFANPKIEFVFSHEPREFIHDGSTVSKVVVEDMKTHERRTLSCDGVFVFAGMQPNLDGLEDGLALDNWGYVKVDGEMRTNLAGVFAAGDVRSTKFRQMTTAVSDGTVAAMVIAKELNDRA